MIVDDCQSVAGNQLVGLLEEIDTDQIPAPFENHSSVADSWSHLLDDTDTH